MQARDVGRELGQRRDLGAQRRPEARDEVLRRVLGDAEAQEGRPPFVALLEQPRVAQDAQVVRHAALLHVERAGELADRELGELEQAEDPEAGRLAEEAQGLPELGGGRDHDVVIVS